MNNDDEMRVIKRNGESEIVAFDKILKRVKSIGSECDIKLNYTAFVMKVIDQIHDGIHTTKIDELAAEQCASLCTQNMDYNTLASRIIISNHHKNTDSTFFSAMQKLYNFIDVNGNKYPLINDKFYTILCAHKETFNNMIDHDRDYLIDYFGFKTLERAYLMKIDGVTIERPQYLWLRVAIAIHNDDIESVKETYDLLSCKYFTHATPTLFNSGTPRPQLSSCFLLSMKNDIYYLIYYLIYRQFISGIC